MLENMDYSYEVNGMDEGWDRLDQWDHLEHLYLPGFFDLFKLHRKDMNHLQAIHSTGEQFEMLSANDSYEQLVFKLFNKMKQHNYMLDMISFSVDTAENDLDELEV